MLYWLSVYSMVAIVVAVPFLLLYLIGFVLSLAVGAVRRGVRSLRVLADSPRPQRIALIRR